MAYSARVRLLPRLIIFVGLGLASCRTHTLEDGSYQFTVKEVLRDDCGLATSAPLLSTGVLITTGNQVKMRYGYLDLQLLGIYQVNLEQMVLDATAVNVTTAVRGTQCLLDSVSLHMDTENQTATSFSGSMSFYLDARADTCVCRVWVTYDAKKVP